MTAPTITIEAMQKEIEAMEERLAGFRQNLNELKKANRKEWNWMSVKEAAEQLKCSDSNVYSLADKGKLESTRDYGRLLVAIKEK